MIKLYQFPNIFDAYHSDPFCMYIEIYLRMMDVPFQTVVRPFSLELMKPKIPYLRDNDKIITGTDSILDYLKNTFGDKLNTHLSSLQKGINYATHCLLEDRLYPAILYSRWIDQTTRSLIKKYYFTRKIFFHPSILQYYLKKRVLTLFKYKILYPSQQIEIYNLGKKSVNSLSNLLGEKLFLGGNSPCSSDACAYACLMNILDVPIPSPLKESIRSYPNLLDYLARMKERYY